MSGARVNRFRPLTSGIHGSGIGTGVISVRRTGPSIQPLEENVFCGADDTESCRCLRDGSSDIRGKTA